MSIFGKIFGADNIIEKGLDLIDGFVYSGEEKAEDRRKYEWQKVQSKVELLKAYAPFKVAQRFLAILFATTYIACFVLVLIMNFFGKTTNDVMEIMATFRIGLIMLTIVGFYFGGGVVDSIRRKTEQP
ncbi:hypothetical protein [Prosthecochloris sp.]|uniref:hypothetical protein n=1 Tax=Prosthecochloris sp. TaxID=290513 RepID=UPI0025DC8E01|nr:hypothetical protein [Prosthecochloris sp.]